MIRVLLTGGGGFIGSNLAGRLVNLGYEVRVLDDFSKGSISNLESIIDDIELVKGDVRDQEIVGVAVKDIDVVVHLAALIDARRSYYYPRDYHDVNVGGSLNLLSSIMGNGVRFIYISSCAVYGDLGSGSVSESNHLSPMSPYAVSKMCVESYCRVYSHCYGLNAMILRLFNVYGTRQNPSSYNVVSTFIDKIRKGEDLIIFGDGKQVRDFVFIDDVIDAIVKAIESEVIDTVNVGSGVGVTINRLASLLLNLMGSDASVKYVGSNAEELYYSVADMSMARLILDFIPRVRLDLGLRKIIDKI